MKRLAIEHTFLAHEHIQQGDEGQGERARAGWRCVGKGGGGVGIEDNCNSVNNK